MTLLENLNDLFGRKYLEKVVHNYAEFEKRETNRSSKDEKLAIIQYAFFKENIDRKNPKTRFKKNDLVKYLNNKYHQPLDKCLDWASKRGYLTVQYINRNGRKITDWIIFNLTNPQIQKILVQIDFINRFRTHEENCKDLYKKWDQSIYPKKNYSALVKNLEVCSKLFPLFYDRKIKRNFFKEYAEVLMRPELKDSIKFFHRDLEICKELVQQYEEIQEFDVAITLRNIINSNNPNNIKNIIDLLKNYLDQHKTEMFYNLTYYTDCLNKAIGICKKAIDRHPRKTRLWNWCGYLYYEAHDFSTAIKYFRAALEYDPEDLKYQWNLAVNYYLNKQIDEALEIMEDLINKRDNPDYYHLIGKIFMEEGDDIKAIEFLKKAESIYNNEEKKADVYIKLGKIYEKNSEKKEAKILFNKSEKTYRKLFESKTLSIYKKILDISDYQRYFKLDLQYYDKVCQEKNPCGICRIAYYYLRDNDLLKAKRCFKNVNCPQKQKHLDLIENMEIFDTPDSFEPLDFDM